MTKEFKPHITEKKKKEVEEVKRLFNEYPVTGIVNLENLPTLQLQRIKRSLKDKILFKITKKRLIKIAIDALDKKNIKDLKEKLVGVPALIFTKEDPFTLYKLLAKSQSSAPAKAGQEAPEDLIVPAGPTNFAPGPMIGELGQLGIKSEIQGGKINIREDKLLVKQGDTISQKAAELLSKLGVEPMKIGLNLTFTYEKGEILGKAVLGVDEEEYIGNIKLAHTEALNLAVFAGYITKETAETLIQKATRESNAVAKATGIETSETMKSKLAEAESAAEKLKKQVPEPEAPKEEPRVEEKKEEPKEEPKEEKKEESKVEEKKEKPKKKTDEEVAQKVLKDLTEGKIKKERGTSRKNLPTRAADPNQQDVGKLITDLKDKKSKGEI